MKYCLIFLTTIFFSATLHAEDSSDALAQQLLTKAGVTGGIVSLPRCGDGALALAVARNSRMVVHAMSADPKIVDRVSLSASSLGILERTLYVEQGTASAIPFADNYVNLLVVADATDQNLAELPAAEILRVLVPETGVALVGLPKGAAGQLSKARLAQWLTGFADAKTSITDDQAGLWAIIRKPRQPGAVSWTHRLFDPSNNPFSQDTACTWPLMTEWLGRPYLDTLPMALVAQGRMAAVRLKYSAIDAVLEVHDAHNGVLLWRRDLPSAAVATRTSGMVLLADGLYLTEGPNVLMFDPATGREKGRVDCAALGAQVKWLAVQDGVLYAMAGSMEKSVQASAPWKSFGETPPNFSRCQAIGAYDLAGSKWLWTQKETNELLNEGMIGLCNDRIYYYVSGKSMVCREAKTGVVVWENPKVVEKVKQFLNGDTRGHLGAVICCEKWVALHRSNTGSIIMSAADGAILWSAKENSLLFYNDLVLAKGGSGDQTYDAATGKPSNAFGQKSLGGGCGMFSVTPCLLCGQFGVTFDLKAGKPLDQSGTGSLDHKTPCLAGSYVAEGLAVGGSSSCTCEIVVRGTIVQASAPTVPHDAQDQQNLLQPSATSAQVQPFPMDASDWPVLRASNERGNASIVRVPDVATLKWSWNSQSAPSPAAINPAVKPAPPDPLASTDLPVQATSAGNLVFVPGQDGSASALDLNTGAVRWRFATGGRLFAPPTIAEDRCYIGSCDGCIYCLEAATGRELWRYRVAPMDRRIMVYGDLMSTWPITGGVLVQDGVVYAAAGILDVDGTYVAALDARSGQVKWRNERSGHLDATRDTGVAACGYPAIFKGRLWIRSVSYDIATGACRPSVDAPRPAAANANLWVTHHTGAVTRYSGLLERDTGLFAHRFLVIGGERFFEDQYMLGSIPGTTEDQGIHNTIEFLQLADDATGKFPCVVPWQQCRIMPAWDDGVLVALPTSHYAKGVRGWPAYHEEDLVCWDAARTAAKFSTLVAKASLNAPLMGQALPKVPGAKEPDKSKGEKFDAPEQLWGVHSPRFFATALAANAVIAAHQSDAGSDPRPGANYALTAYDRADGKARWEIPLPSQPLMDGLSVARDGSVLVRLLNGGLVCVGAGKS